METSTCLETTQQEMTNFTVRLLIDRTGPCSATPLSVQSSYRYQNILRIGEVFWQRIDAKISPKAASEKAQTTVSENTYTFPNIDVFRTGHFIASSANRKQCAGVIFGTPGTTYLSYSLVVSQNVYAVFPPRLSVRIYLSSDDC